MPLIRMARELRVDFFRGLALWWIFLDHMGNNWLSNFTLHNFALCDATEVFVLLAGYAAGIAYGRTFDRQGWLPAAADVVRRAWTLYIAHIFLFVVFAAQVAYSASALNRGDFLDEIHLDVLGETPYQALLQALILNFQPAFLNILPMYIMLLLFFAVALPLLRWPTVLGAVSLLVYAVARLAGLNFPSWIGGGWYFNPLTWQLLFMLGAILSYAPGEVPLRHRAIDVMAGAVAVFGLLEQWVIWQHPELTSRMPPVIARALLAVDKEGLHPFRLISILSLAWLAVRLIPADARWLQSRTASGFVLCGQHSLPVFCAGIFLSFLGRIALTEDDGWMMQVAVNVAGAAAMLGIAAVTAWYGARARARGRPVPPSPRPDIA